MRRAAVVVLTFLLLAGCGGPSYTPEPYAGPLGAATADPPVRPPEATGTSLTSAKAFVAYWIDVLDYSRAVGETRVLRRLAAPGCAACASLADEIDRVHDAGGSLGSGGWTLIDAQVDPVAPGTPRVLATVRIAALTVVPSAGASPSTEAAEPATNRVFALEIGDDGWLVADLTDR